MLNYNQNYECHCCGSTQTDYIQHYVLRRSLSVAPMYLCQNCKSISVDFNDVKKHYPQSKSSDAIAFHKYVRERNEKWSRVLLQQIRTIKGQDYQPSCIIDIGCGIGTLLGVAADNGLRSVGYDIDPLAIAEARKDSRLIIHDSLFSYTSHQEINALVCCIAVLEHLHRPLSLLRDIAKYCRSGNHSAFIFVPLLPDNWSRFLFESVTAKGNPFFDNEEHVTHFSTSSFESAWLEAFGSEPIQLAAGGWVGYFYRGVTK
jgi:SAM-dependent methyltransferase